MNVPTKLATFAALLLAVFAAALWVGVAVGPIDLPTRTPHAPHVMSMPTSELPRGSASNRADRVVLGDVPPALARVRTDCGVLR